MFTIEKYNKDDNVWEKVSNYFYKKERANSVLQKIEVKESTLLVPNSYRIVEVIKSKDSTGESFRKGRPKGSKDKTPRKRRTKAEMYAAFLAATSPATEGEVRSDVLSDELVTFADNVEQSHRELAEDLNNYDSTAPYTEHKILHDTLPPDTTTPSQLCSNG